MARQANPYPYFNTRIAGIQPTAFTANPVFFSPQYGLDTSTGKRDSERVNQALSENPFATGSESVQFSGVPSYGVAENINSDLYENIFDRLAKKSLALEGKQQLLGLGSGLAFSAASLPLVERLRNLDYQLGLKADIESPTAQAARNTALQNQFATASGQVSDRLRALAAVRQAASSGFNLSA